MHGRNIGRLSIALGIAALALAMTAPAYAAGATACAVLGEVEINGGNGVDLAGLEPTPTPVNFAIVANSTVNFNTGVCTSAPTTNALSASGTVNISTESPISTIEVDSWTAGNCTGGTLSGLAYGAVALLGPGTGTASCGGALGASGDVLAVASFAPAAEENTVTIGNPCTSVCLNYATFYGGFTVADPD